MSTVRLQDRINEIRSFNRFYTRKIGVLQEAYLDTRFSLAEARVLYEIANRQRPTATEVGTALELDPGYLSRILRRFESEGLITKSRSPEDARSSLIGLTRKGLAAFKPLDARSRDEVGKLIGKLPPEKQERLMASFAEIRRLLADGMPLEGAPYSLRPHRAGDLGWVVARHGTLYAEEYGWDLRFEAMVAEIVAAFVRTFDPARERCWIAEKDGERVGSIFVVRESDEVAKLRLLLVEPSARGLGLGHHLVAECIRFAREAGYKRMVLWTHGVLTAARHIYETAGFVLTSTGMHADFGPEVTSEIWSLDL